MGQLLSPSLIVGLVVILTLYCAWGLAWLVRRRMTISREEHIDSRPDEHIARILALREWLTDPEVTKVLLQTRTATKIGMQSILDNLDAIPEQQLTALVGVMLQNRTVRLVIAASMRRNHGDNKADALRSLMEWAQPVREHREANRLIGMAQSPPKPILKTVGEARKALADDKLGCVYRKVGEVFVVTASGTGIFKPEEWDS